MPDPILTPLAAMAVKQFAVPVTAKLIEHLLDNDKSLRGDLLGTLIDKGADLAKDQLAARLKAKPQRLIEAHEHLFLGYTGWVIGELIKQAAQQPVFEKERKALVAFANDCPKRWKTFVLKGTTQLNQAQQQQFLDQLANALATGQAVTSFDDIPFNAFFSWNTPLNGDLPDRLDTHLKKNLGNALQSLLVKSDKEATEAWKLIVNTGINDVQKQLGVLTGVVVGNHEATMEKLADMSAQFEQFKDQFFEELRKRPVGTDPVQLASDKDFLRSFEARKFLYFYELHRVHQQTRELGIRDSRRGHEVPPAVWDAFIFPSCRTAETPADVIENAKHDLTQLTPPLESLLDQLAQEDNRRFVLLGDPGTGKSTVIQFLCAVLGLHHARPAFDEKSFPAVDPIETLPSSLRQTIPLPFILRELCGHFGDQPDDWTWDRLEHAFLHGPPTGSGNASPLRVFRDQESAFREQVLASPQAWFLIDGLDEIGSPEKRRALVKAIQAGMWKYPKARWLITSRIVGYNEAPVDQWSCDPQITWDGDVNEVMRVFEKFFVTEERVRIAALAMKRLELVGWNQDCALAQFNQSSASQQRLYDQTLRMVGEFKMAEQRILTAVAEADDDETADRIVRELSERFGDEPEIVPTLPQLPPPFTFAIAHVRYLAPFDNTQRRDFLWRWFTLRGYQFPDKTIDAFVDQQITDIDQREAEGVRLLSRIPNMLSYMAVLVRDGTQLPDGRAKLYHAIAHAYLESLDFEHRHLYDLPAQGQTVSPDRTPPVTPDQARTFLRRLAIALMQRHGDGTAQTGTQVNHVTADQALVILRPLIDEWLRKPAFADHHCGCNHEEIIAEILHYLSRRSGLIVEIGPKEHGFVHLSFLEFFAAEWLSNEFTRLNDRDAETTRKARLSPHALATHLDTKYPPPPDFAYDKDDLRTLADRTAWRETLIFLAELRADPAHGHEDAQDVLVELLFPPLAPNQLLDQPLPELTESECRLTDDVPLTFAAAALAIRISQDPAIALEPALCHHWWTFLWLHRLRCKRDERLDDPEKAWHIAPELLARQPTRAEVIRSLDTALRCVTGNGARVLKRRLDLRHCTSLQICDLSLIRQGSGVEDLDLKGCTGLRSTQGLGSFKSLSVLVLQNCTGLEGTDALQGLAGLEKLEYLELTGCTGLRSTQGLGSLKSLKQLYLSNCKNLEGEEALQGLAGMDNLETLYLNGCTGLRSTQGLGSLKSLRKLYMQNCTALEDAEALQGLAGMDNLETLYLNGCTGLRSTQGLGSLKSLRTLNLQKCTGLDEADALQGLAGLDTLEVLDLIGCTGLRSTQGLGSLKSLRTLHMQNCTALEGAEALQGLAGMDTLEELNLTGCTGLRSTQGLPVLPAIVALYMSNCTGLQSEKALAGLLRLEKLRNLDLRGCTGLTGKHIATFRQWVQERRGSAVLALNIAR